MGPDLDSGIPGIFDVDGLDDWEPGIPIDRDRIRQKDDDYWDQHKTTPKAFVSLAAARAMWSNRFGDATAVRFTLKDPDKPLVEQLRAHLKLTDLGMTSRDLPAEAAAAVAGSFDFGALFASMSFFLIIAALVLAGLVFVFGIEQRATQIGLLLALGFTRKRVRRLFLVEALVLLPGRCGARFARRLCLHPPRPPRHVGRLAGRGGGDGVRLFPEARLARHRLCHHRDRRARRGLVREPPCHRGAAGRADFGIRGGISGLAGATTPRRDHLLGRTAAALGCLFAPKVPGTMAEQGLFFGAGFLITLAGVALCSILIRRFLRPSRTLASLGALGRQHTVRRRGRSLAVIGLMAAGVFMVTAINSFRLDGARGAERRGAGTGGFAYVGESTLPVYEDLDSAAGRKKFGLDAMKQPFSVISLRVSDGEDASCLNLNRAQRPRLMGVPVESFAKLSPFHFTAQASPPPTGQSPWRALSADVADEDGLPVIPGIIDQNTAVYALQKKVGDTVRYETVSGQAFAVRLVGFLETSILQGSLLIDEAEFIRFFPDAGGYRFFLLDGAGADPETLAPVASHLTRMFGDLGLEMRPAADRLNEFNAVQNTYLSIFSTLGGLGLFLGTLGLAILVGRNVMERRGQLGVMQAMGFTRRALSGMVLSEHWFLHLSGVVVGLGAAILAVLPKLTGGSAPLPWGLLAAINGAVLVGGLLFCAAAARTVLRGTSWTRSAGNEDQRGLPGAFDRVRSACRVRRGKGARPRSSGRARETRTRQQRRRLHPRRHHRRRGQMVRRCGDEIPPRPARTAPRRVARIRPRDPRKRGGDHPDRPAPRRTAPLALRRGTLRKKRIPDPDRTGPGGIELVRRGSVLLRRPFPLDPDKPLHLELSVTGSASTGSFPAGPGRTGADRPADKPLFRAQGLRGRTRVPLAGRP